MNSTVHDLLDLALRWIHLIAGIMWIGNSMLFNWLDRNLEQGKIWLVHGGGFYDIEKKQLTPSELPTVLHWFKWQAYSTWITGFLLLGVVYYMGSGALLIDPNVSDISAHEAMAVGLGMLVVGWLFYDSIWRSPLRRYSRLTMGICLVGCAVVIYFATHIFSGRAAVIQVGAMLGTLMAGNVFFHIIPSQRQLVRDTEEGRPQNQLVAANAKQRSIHNNYLTFPVLFMMVSNHFPIIYANRNSWLILIIISCMGASIRHFMNIRFVYDGWLKWALASAIFGISTTAYLVIPKSVLYEPKVVLFSDVQQIIQNRCVSCHSATPTDKVFTVPPNGVRFDHAQEIRLFSNRIYERAVVSKTMPLANQTKMTEEERATLAAWFMGNP